MSQCGQPTTAALNDTWTYSNGVWTNLTASLSEAPSPRWGMAMVYDPALRSIVLFGGSDNWGNVNAETWLFNGTWSQVALSGPSPPALYGAGATYDPTLGGALLYGGQNGYGGPIVVHNQTWLFAHGNWSTLTANGPPPLRSSVLLYDPATNQTLLFGGFDGLTDTASNETWDLSGGGWAQLTPPNSPSARFAFGGAYDPVRGDLVIFGGFSWEYGSVNLALNDTWVYGNGRWTNVTPTAGPSPGARGAPRLVWDSADGYGLLFGGQANGDRDSDTWVFPFAPTAGFP